jgi:hypothetical protein|nr:MAG TPA: hypothetical protein [Caudoviricetes sp.]
MNLTKYEQETIINYNNEEKTASIFTYDKSLIRKLDKRLAEMSDMKLIRRGEDFAEYSLPKKWIKVTFPRQYSDEQRAEMAERMKAAREK